MRILRLLLFPECNRKCEGCCNKKWDLDALPVVNPERIGKFDQVLLTGGEPMIRPHVVAEAIAMIRKKAPNADIFMYTAKTIPIHSLLEIMKLLDGITLTLHEQSDVKPFLELHNMLNMLFKMNITYGSLRLNVFSEVTLPHIDLSPWIVRDGMEWVEECPLPTNEVFMRYRSPHNKKSLPTRSTSNVANREVFSSFKPSFFWRS
jgi:pyruvate-formate lyase-activating enzyme